MITFKECIQAYSSGSELNEAWGIPFMKRKTDTKTPNKSEGVYSAAHKPYADHNHTISELNSKCAFHAPDHATFGRPNHEGMTPAKTVRDVDMRGDGHVTHEHHYDGENITVHAHRFKDGTHAHLVISDHITGGHNYGTQRVKDLAKNSLGMNIDHMYDNPEKSTSYESMSHDLKRINPHQSEDNLKEFHSHIVKHIKKRYIG